MVEALKKLDKKFLIFAGSIIILPVVIILFLAIFQSCGSRKITNEKYEEKMIAAAERYMKKNKLEPKEEAAVVKVSLDKLVKNKYIKSTDKLLGDDSCEGFVIVRRNGSTVEENNGGFLNYIANLECDSYKTDTLLESIKKDLVTEKSGLYENDNGYIFKGDQVANYLNFYGVLYRVMSVDKNGLAKIIKVDSENYTQVWDNKYNTEVKYSSGKNIYEDSNILKKLLVYYKDNKKIKLKAKPHVVSYDVCVGARPIDDDSLANDNDCSAVLKNQVATLINITDYANASLDSECINIKSLSCNNYNYLKQLSLSTWTVNSVSDNTYEAYYLQTGVIRHQEASENEDYNIIIYIDSLEKVSSGKGSKNEPYVIE